MHPESGGRGSPVVQIMRFLPLTALTALALAVGAAPAPAMSGGTLIDIATAPFMATSFQCSGTLIAPDRVLMAAHCLDDIDFAGFGVFVGADVSTGQFPEEKFFAAKGWAPAPGFKLEFPFSHDTPQEATAVNDVGIIVLDRPVPGVTPVPIAGPRDEALERPGTPVRLLGFGDAPGPPPPFPNPPRSGNLTLISNRTCEQSYPNAVNRDDICAQDLDGNATLTQPCGGDSGGAPIAGGPPGPGGVCGPSSGAEGAGPGGPVIVGVTSWGAEVMGNGCGEAALPGVWMRVSHFRDFITDPHPTLAPWTAGKVTLSGTGKLTCDAPAFEGSRAKLSYQWGIPRFPDPLIQAMPDPLEPIAGATKKHFRTGGPSSAGKRLVCAVTATNASGSWTVYSLSVNG